MSKPLEWVLRIGVFGEFLGHGVFALQGKAQWVSWIVDLLGVSLPTASLLLSLIGLSDLIVAILALLFPLRAILAWAALWGFWTALVRPLVGLPVWDFVERWANWAAPLALLYVRGIPRAKHLSDWLK